MKCHGNELDEAVDHPQAQENLPCLQTAEAAAGEVIDDSCDQREAKYPQNDVHAFPDLLNVGQQSDLSFWRQALEFGDYSEITFFSRKNSSCGSLLEADQVSGRGLA